MISNASPARAPWRGGQHGRCGRPKQDRRGMRTTVKIRQRNRRPNQSRPSGPPARGWRRRLPAEPSYFGCPRPRESTPGMQPRDGPTLIVGCAPRCGQKPERSVEAARKCDGHRNGCSQFLHPSRHANFNCTDSLAMCSPRMLLRALAAGIRAAGSHAGSGPCHASLRSASTVPGGPLRQR